MSEKTPKLGIEGLDSHTDSEREYLDQQKRKSDWPDDHVTKPEWPDRRKILIKKIADKPALDFLKTLENRAMRQWTEGYRSVHAPALDAQACATAHGIVESCMYEDEDDITFAELEKRFLKKYEKVVDGHILRSRLDRFI